MNWPQLLKACEDSNIEWGVVEQDVCPGDPFESLAISLQNLDRLGLQA